VAEHFIESHGRTFELRTITFAPEEVHRVLDDIEEVEQLGDGPTQLGCVSSAWRRCKHVEKMGASGICFKRAKHDSLVISPFRTLKLGVGMGY
jgi:hypothetical protein